MTAPELNALFVVNESLTDLANTLHAALDAINSLNRAVHLHATGRGSLDDVHLALSDYRHAVQCDVPGNLQATEEAIAEVLYTFA